MQDTFAIRRIEPSDAIRLGEFFARLAADAEVAKYFHPHPMAPLYAVELCHKSPKRKDRYYVATYAGRIVGYSMLRGWDEGYEVPSWGGCTHPDLRDAKLGQCLLTHGIAESIAAGSPRLRLTVFKDNARAVHVYAKHGFVYQDKNAQEFIGVLDLVPPPTITLAHPDMSRLAAWSTARISRAA